MSKTMLIHLTLVVIAAEHLVKLKSAI